MIVIRDELSALLQALRDRVGGHSALPTQSTRNPSGSVGASDFSEPSPFVEYDGATRRVFVLGFSDYGPDSEDVVVPANLSKRKANRYFLVVRDR